LHTKFTVEQYVRITTTKTQVAMLSHNKATENKWTFNLFVFSSAAKFDGYVHMQY